VFNQILLQTYREQESCRCLLIFIAPLQDAYQTFSDRVPDLREQSKLVTVREIGPFLV
jgi:hypothetical protein